MLLRDKYIFLVEDNIGNQAITKTLLEAHGATVGIHATGQNIIPHLKKFHALDLIILDLMLPDGVTGYDIFSVIRSDATFDDVPVIAMSVVDRSVAITETKIRGFSGFISKPIKFDIFPALVAGVIDGEAIW